MMINEIEWMKKYEEYNEYNNQIFHYKYTASAFKIRYTLENNLLRGEANNLLREQVHRWWSSVSVLTDCNYIYTLINVNVLMS